MALRGALVLLVLLLTADGAPATLRTDFRVFWNVPTFMCHRYGMNFSDVHSRWGIVQNHGDLFRGDRMVILYDPGEFPALLQDKRGNLQFRNGGVPQEGDLARHLSKLRAQVDELVPDHNFRGLGVIDFEKWRPIWRQNWASMLPYQDVSRKIEKRHQPFWWTPKQIEAEASRRFENAARDFLLSSLELVKQMRPSGQWGYYIFPYCFNYTPKNMKPSCEAQVQHENDELRWLFDSSTALFPSLYLSKLNTTPERRVQFAIGRMNETVRVARNVPRLEKPTVNAYIRYRYQDVGEFLTQEDLRNSLAVVNEFHAGGAVLWGSSNDTNSQQKCSALEHYLNTVLGPTIMELSARIPEVLFLGPDPK
ncbi:Hyaluronidase [Cryptotermes secundus]|uniref:Hyaluronidase n=1 Tax=Cryptotermes secundus TaxID=105785 RepID=A0A2J7RFH8_9NEOP|nr:Hyaluronidase [Cryptotermes secundus]